MDSPGSAIPRAVAASGAVAETPAAPRGMATAESHWQRWTMDMQIIVTDPDALAAARCAVDAELDAIDAAASRFNPDSEINALTRSGRPTKVSELLAELLGAALLAAQQTDGDIDPTIGARLIDLGYDRDIAAVDSSVPLVMSVSQSADWSMVSLDGRMVTVPLGVVLDLGSTAKAVAADRCAAQAHRITGAGVLVNLGGDIATAGDAPDEGWQVLVCDGDDEPAAMVALSPGVALATSSTLRRRWRHGQRAMHHIVDPRSGWPAEPVWRTVSVVAASCLAANTVSTAAVIRGWRAVDWIRAQRLPARLVDSDGIVHTLGGWPAESSDGRR
ncbi:FAD:protein FMN transferase [Mycolicibacterium aichiense]|uniref:FAD:protein FMN transferase n=1 Tax=Mycolicibacterium aichiense TaxID=1799 RepID=UPI003D66D479